MEEGAGGGVPSRARSGVLKVLKRGGGNRGVLFGSTRKRKTKKTGEEQREPHNIRSPD